MVEHNFKCARHDNISHIGFLTKFLLIMLIRKIYTARAVLKRVCRYDWSGIWPIYLSALGATCSWYFCSDCALGMIASYVFIR